MSSFEWVKESDDFGTKSATLMNNGKSLIEIEILLDDEMCYFWCNGLEFLFANPPVFDNLRDAQKYTEKTISGWCKNFLEWRK